VTEKARAIRSVCVAGAGIVGLSAALAFARALRGVAVTLVETPNGAGLVDRSPASLPTIHRFHRAIGFDELELVREGIATHLLGTRFDGWSASGDPWFHVFGEHGLPAGDVAFHALWQRHPERLAFHRYAAAGVLAEAGRFAHPSADLNAPMGTFLYGLRLDPRLYLERLRAAAAALPRTGAAIGEIERRSDGGIAALLLENGQRVEADLFLDCTGPGAALLSRLDGAFEDWGHWLPCDRFSFTDEAQQDPTSCDRVERLDTGWRWRSPLLDRTLLVEAGSASFGGDGEIVQPAGRRPRPWVHNVLALGEAAVAVEPLHGASLHLAHSGILRALELLPGRDCHPLELREYNRRTEQEAIRVRDFLALPYLRSGRSDSPLWRDLAGREPPPSLARTLEQFTRRGRLPLFEEESFDRHSWLAALLGLGVIPDHVDPAAPGVDQERARAAMDAYAARLNELAARVPPYRDMLARLRAAPARKAG
jgi:tryptophan 7-halogenase